MCEWGNAIGDYGGWAYVAIAVLAALGALSREGKAAAPGAVLVLVGAWLFRENHIYWPDGVIAMLALAVGWVVLLSAVRRRGATRRPVAKRAGRSPSEAGEGLGPIPRRPKANTAQVTCNFLLDIHGGEESNPRHGDRRARGAPERRPFGT